MSLGRIQIDLEARIAKFESDMGRAARILQRDMVNAQRSAEAANRRMTQTMERNAARVEQSARAAAAVVAGIFAVREIARWAGALSRVADGYANIQAKVRLAAGENANLSQSIEQVFGVAQRTFQTLDGTAALVQRGAMALQNFGQEADEAFSNSIQLAEIFNKSLVVSGAGTQEAAAAALQFSQALASNKFSGDEFRSVMENNSRFAQLLADSLGVDIAKLREMSKAGELTVQTFLDMIGKTGNLNEQFERMPLTIGRATTKLDNAFTKFIGQADQARGASAGVAAAIDALASNIGPIASGMAQLGIVIAGAFAGRALLAIQTMGRRIIDQAQATRVAEAAARQKGAADTAAASQALHRARAEQISLEAAQRAIVVDRQRIQSAIGLANAQMAAIRAAGLRATSEIELARLSQQLTAVESARAAATAALGAARQREVAINAELLLSNRALVAAQTAAGVAGAAAATRITLGMRAAQAATAAMTVASRAAAGALALVGGPIGVAIIGLGLLAGAFMSAKAQADQARASFDAAAQAAANFQDSPSMSGALASGSALLSSREMLRQQIASRQANLSDLRFNPIARSTGLYESRQEELRRDEAALAEVNRQLERNSQLIANNHEEWARAAGAVSETTDKYEKQNQELEEQRQKLVAERLELTQGYRARLEYEAMQKQGVATAAQLDAGTRSKIDALAKEHGALQAARDAQKDKTKADKAAVKDVDQLRNAYNNLNASLDRRLALLGQEGEAAGIAYDLKHGAFAGFGDPAGALAKAEEIDQGERMLEMRREAASLFEQTRTEAERFEALQKRLNLLEEEGLMTAERRVEIEERSRPISRAEEAIASLQHEIELLGVNEQMQYRLMAARIAGADATAKQVEELAKLLQLRAQAAEASYEWQRFEYELADTITALSRNLADAENILKSFFDSIAEQIMRSIAEDWAGTITDWFKGLGNSADGTPAKGSFWQQALSSIVGLFGGNREFGGDVSAGRFYEVNERRPELLSVGGKDFLMMGGQDGHVSPGVGAGGGDITQNFYYQERVDHRTAAQAASDAGYAVRQATARNSA